MIDNWSHSQSLIRSICISTCLRSPLIMIPTQEAVQTAMNSFHKHLPEDVRMKDIELKYKFREPGEWAGLAMAEASGDVWRWMLSTDSTPEIGVFTMARLEEPADDFGPNEPRPKMSIFARTNKSTGNYFPTSYMRITTPSSYEVRVL